MNMTVNHDFNRKSAPVSRPVHIETPRLILREIIAADKDAFREITTHPGFYYYCFDGSERKLDAFMGECEKTRMNTVADGSGNLLMLAVTLKDSDDIIGHSSLLRITEYALPVQGIDYEAAYFIAAFIRDSSSFIMIKGLSDS